MKTRIVRIGNSQGIRLPKLLLQQAGLTQEVAIEVEGNCLVIRPARAPRAGWAQAFRGMADAGDDRLLDDETATAFDRSEWRWR